MPNNWVNSMQTKDTRRTKYKLCRMLGERVVIAQTFRDYTWTNVSKKLEILGHTRKEINEMFIAAREIVKRSAKE